MALRATTNMVGARRAHVCVIFPRGAGASGAAARTGRAPVRWASRAAESRFIVVPAVSEPQVTLRLVALQFSPRSCVASKLHTLLERCLEGNLCLLSGTLLSTLFDLSLLTALPQHRLELRICFEFSIFSMHWRPLEPSTRWARLSSRASR